MTLAFFFFNPRTRTGKPTGSELGAQQAGFMEGGRGEEPGQCLSRCRSVRSFLCWRGWLQSPARRASGPRGRGLSLPLCGRPGLSLPRSPVPGVPSLRAQASSPGREQLSACSLRSTWPWCRSTARPPTFSPSSEGPALARSSQGPAGTLAATFPLLAPAARSPACLLPLLCVSFPSFYTFVTALVKCPTVLVALVRL